MKTTIKSHPGLKALAASIALLLFPLAFSPSRAQAADNTATGTGALISISTGTGNTADGYQALTLDNAGGGNTAVGAYSLWKNTNGANNTASGYQSLVNNQNGSWNTAYGTYSLAANTAAYNTGLGASALYSNISGGFNTATGFQALYFNTGGSYNTADGAYALLNSKGAYNTATGYSALIANLGGNNNTAAGCQALSSNTSGSSNVAVGFQALNKNTSGSFNVAIGDGALLNTTGTGNIAMGEDSGSNLTTGSNNIYIGNQGATLTGTSNQTIGTPFSQTESGTIRIGTSGTHSAVYFSGKLYGDGSGLTGFTGLGNGSVTTANLNLLSRIQIGSPVAPGSEGMIRLVTTASTGLNGRTWDIGVPNGGTNATGKNYSFVIDDTQRGTEPEFMVQWGTGHVGIGTSSPGFPLDVSSASETAINGRTTGAGTNGVQGVSNSSFGSGVWGENSGGGFGVYGQTGTTSSLPTGGSTTKAAVRGSAVGTGSANYGVYGSSGSGVGVYGVSSTNDAIHGLAKVTNKSGVWGENSANGNGVAGISVNGTGVYAKGGEWAGYFDGNTRVAGTLTVDVLTIQGADVAEPFDIAEAELPKGTVVVIDSERLGGLKRSTRAYDNHVAGIVSGANGIRSAIIMSQPGVNEGGQNVALSGRVYVQADASNGAIQPGDMLTTSDKPGHAMKATDHDRAQGAIIGKAMSSLEEGTGMVLVLVTLQ